MIGEPKYTLHQSVEFTIAGKTVKGEIRIIDKYGTLEQNEEASFWLPALQHRLRAGRDTDLLSRS